MGLERQRGVLAGGGDHIGPEREVRDELTKIRQVRDLLDSCGGTDVHVEVDGGIGPSTIAGAAAAGANVLVAGSALYRDPEGLAHAVQDLRTRAEAARTAT